MLLPVHQGLPAAEGLGKLIRFAVKPVTTLLPAALAAVAFALAAPAHATPCDTGGMSTIEYALDVAVPGIVPEFTPGASCSKDSDCNSTSQKCEGGSCCVKSDETCSGLGYCCGHPSQGCVNGKCP